MLQEAVSDQAMLCRVADGKITRLGSSPPSPGKFRSCNHTFFIGKTRNEHTHGWLSLWAGQIQIGRRASCFADLLVSGLPTHRRQRNRQCHLSVGGDRGLWHNDGLHEYGRQRQSDHAAFLSAVRGALVRRFVGTSRIFRRPSGDAGRSLVDPSAGEYLDGERARLGVSRCGTRAIRRSASADAGDALI